MLLLHQVPRFTQPHALLSGNQGRESPPEAGEAHPSPSRGSLEQHLDVVGSQHDPAAEAVAQVDDGHAAAEADDVGEGHPQRHDEDLGGWKNPRGSNSVLWGMSDVCQEGKGTRELG